MRVLTCGNDVELRGFEPLTPSMRTSVCIVTDIPSVCFRTSGPRRWGEPRPAAASGGACKGSAAPIPLPSAVRKKLSGAAVQGAFPGRGQNRQGCRCYRRELRRLAPKQGGAGCGRAPVAVGCQFDSYMWIGVPFMGAVCRAVGTCGRVCGAEHASSEADEQAAAAPEACVMARPAGPP